MAETSDYYFWRLYHSIWKLYSLSGMNCLPAYKTIIVALPISWLMDTQGILLGLTKSHLKKNYSIKTFLSEKGLYWLRYFLEQTIYLIQRSALKIGPYPVPNQHVPLDEYKYNINFIIDHLRLIFFNAKGIFSHHVNCCFIHFILFSSFWLLLRQLMRTRWSQ